METETKAALKGGYTAVICMANTKPVIDSVELYEEVMSRADTLPTNFSGFQYYQGFGRS